MLGHSTGGLDSRLVASPSAHIPVAPEKLAWLPRLRSVTTMSTPHYGTPLASFFATVSGQRMLYAVSALTFIGLSLGAPPLPRRRRSSSAIGQLDRRVLGAQLGLIDRASNALLGVLEPAQSREVRDFLDAISTDQGAMIQLTPEAMDLFQSGVEDRPGILYQSTVAAAPPPSARRLARAMLSPWRAISSTLFTTLYGITSRTDANYPCAAPDADEQLMLAPLPPAADAAARTTASYRRSRRCGGRSSGPARPTTSTSSATSASDGAPGGRLPLWKRLFTKKPDASTSTGSPAAPTSTEPTFHDAGWTPSRTGMLSADAASKSHTAVFPRVGKTEENSCEELFRFPAAA